MPVGHVGLWARGLWHGFNGDFPSAVSVLVPQVEQFIRVQLKARGAYTFHIGDGGVETEKSLGSLLDMDETTSSLGPNLVFEVRALLNEQLGPNLRNELAHGLIDDASSWSTASVYAWWLCLRLVIAPISASMKETPRVPTSDGWVSFTAAHRDGYRLRTLRLRPLQSSFTKYWTLASTPPRPRGKESCRSVRDGRSIEKVPVNGD